MLGTKTDPIVIHCSEEETEIPKSGCTKVTLHMHEIFPVLSQMSCDNNYKTVFLFLVRKMLYYRNISIYLTYLIYTYSIHGHAMTFNRPSMACRGASVSC